MNLIFRPDDNNDDDDIVLKFPDRAEGDKTPIVHPPPSITIDRRGGRNSERLLTDPGKATAVPAASILETDGGAARISKLLLTYALSESLVSTDGPTGKERDMHPRKSLYIEISARETERLHAYVVLANKRNNNNKNVKKKREKRSLKGEMVNSFSLSLQFVQRV